MLGYWRGGEQAGVDPELTGEVLAGGWLRTGDAGRLESDGSLVITDRIKDLMKTSGGKYVAPQPLEADLSSDLFIEQAAVIGDQRNYVTALIVPAFPILEDWARAHGMSWSSRHELIQRPEVLRLYQERLDAHNAQLARYEQIKKFTLLPKEFSLEGGELTPTMKTRRKQVQASYRDVIERMYREAA
jgi:long-chain acyl-CoA synthetase